MGERSGDGPPWRLERIGEVKEEGESERGEEKGEIEKEREGKLGQKTNGESSIYRIRDGLFGEYNSEFFIFNLQCLGNS